MTEEENKELVSKYPFLQMRKFDDTPIPGGNYLDGMPPGWIKAFGRQMCEDFAKAATEDGVALDYLRIIDVKEKYGSLRWYWGRTDKSKKLERITTLYEEVAAAFCAKCGAHPVMMTRGYILPLCEKCWEKWKEHSLSEDIREFKPEFPVVTSSRTENGVTVEETLPLKELFDSIVARQKKD